MAAATAEHLKEAKWQAHPVYAEDFFERTRWQYFELLQHDCTAPLILSDHDDGSAIYGLDGRIPETDSCDLKRGDYNGRSYNHGLLLLMAAIQSGTQEDILKARDGLRHFPPGVYAAWRTLFELRFGGSSASTVSVEPPVTWLSMLGKEKENYLRMQGKWALLRGRPDLAERFFVASKRFEHHEDTIDHEVYNLDELIAHAKELQSFYSSEKK